MKKILTLVLLMLAMLASSASQSQVPPQSQFERYRATMSGPNEAPPNNSVAYGIVDLLIDRNAWTMRLTVDLRDFSGGGSPAAHIHCCTPQALAGTAAVATMLPSLPGFPDYNNYLAGAYERTFQLNDAATYNAAFINANGGTVTAARDVLLAGLAGDRAYFNVHSAAYPQGEMRGFLVPTPVPEPQAWALLLAGLAGVTVCARRRAGIPAG